MTWALKLPKETLGDSSARHVLLCLANYAGTEGRDAFPSAATLANETGLSERTVRYKLDVLEDAGLIVRGKQAIAAVHIDRHDRRPVVYDLQLKRGANSAPRDEQGADDDSQGGTGCKPRQNGVQSTTERGAESAPNPSLIPQGTEEQLQREAGVPEAEMQRQNAAALEQRLDRRFAMFAGWIPDERQITAQLQIAGMANADLPEAAIRSFVGFFVAKPNTIDSMGGWCYRLAAWLKRERTKAAARGAEPDFEGTDWAKDLGDL